MLFLVRMILLNITFWVVLHFSIGRLIVSLPEKLRKMLFDYHRSFFRVSPPEMRFYRKIRLPEWKDRLPQHNPDFNKRHLPQRIDREYLEKFLLVTCQSEIIHYLISFFGYLSLLFSFLCDRPKNYVPLFFTIATGMAFCNFPFAWIQRYNRYRLAKTLNELQSRKTAAARR